MTVARVLAIVCTVGVATLMGIGFLCFAVIVVRNLVSTAQLLLAAKVFATRIRPATRSYVLCMRYADLALPVSFIAP